MTFSHASFGRARLTDFKVIPRQLPISARFMRSVIWSVRGPRLASNSAQQRGKSVTRASAGKNAYLGTEPPLAAEGGADDSDPKVRA